MSLTGKRAWENWKLLEQRLIALPFIADAPTGLFPPAVDAVLRAKGEDSRCFSAPILAGRRVYLFETNEAWNAFCETFASKGARRLFTLEGASR